MTYFVADCHFLQQQLGLLHIVRLQSKRQHSSSQPLTSREYAGQQKESCCLYPCYQKGWYMLKSAGCFQDSWQIMTEPMQLKAPEHSSHQDDKDYICDLDFYHLKHYFVVYIWYVLSSFISQLFCFYHNLVSLFLLSCFYFTFVLCFFPPMESTSSRIVL